MKKTGTHLKFYIRSKLESAAGIRSPPTSRRLSPTPLLITAAEMLPKMSAVHAAEIPEQILKVAKQIVKIEIAGLEAALLAEGGMAHLIVLATAIRIAKHFVRLGDLAKFLLCVRLRGFVRVVFEGEFAEGFFHLLVRGAFFNAKGSVVVFVAEGNFC